MHFKGVVKKMTTEFNSTINYFVEFENSFIHLNQFLDHDISINFFSSRIEVARIYFPHLL